MSNAVLRLLFRCARECWGMGAKRVAGYSTDDNRQPKRGYEAMMAVGILEGIKGAL